MKIVNKKKFIRSVIIILSILILFLFGMNSITYSKRQVLYKEDYIIQGDTLWSIAEKQLNTNEYYKGQDIRKVIYDIEKVNNISNEKLTIGQKIIIPYI